MEAWFSWEMGLKWHKYAEMGVTVILPSGDCSLTQNCQSWVLRSAWGKLNWGDLEDHDGDLGKHWGFGVNQPPFMGLPSSETYYVPGTLNTNPQSQQPYEICVMVPPAPHCPFYWCKNWALETLSHLPWVIELDSGWAGIWSLVWLFPNQGRPDLIREGALKHLGKTGKYRMVGSRRKINSH